MSGWVRLECGLQYELPVVWDTGRDWLKYQVVLIATIVSITWLAWDMYTIVLLYLLLFLIRDLLSCYAYPLFLYLVLATFFCGGILLMYMDTLHCIYSVFCISCRHRYCICTTQYWGYITYAHLHVHIAYAHLHVHFYHVTPRSHYLWYKLDTTIDMTRW